MRTKPTHPSLPVPDHAAPNTAAAVLASLLAISCSTQPGFTQHENDFELDRENARQHEQVDLNRVFRLSVGVIDDAYWRDYFAANTRAGFYDDFFRHFVARLRELGTIGGLQNDAPETRRRMMQGMVTSFTGFCESRGVGSEWSAFWRSNRVDF